MRSTVGDIAAADASDLPIALFDECRKIAAKHGFDPRPPFVERTSKMFTAPGSPLAASMMRDIERGAPTEADHILGDLLLRRGAASGPSSLLYIAYAHIKAYEARRARETSAKA